MQRIDRLGDSANAVEAISDVMLDWQLALLPRVDELRHLGA